MPTYSHPYRVLFYQADMQMNRDTTFQDILRKEPPSAAERYQKINGTNYEMEVLEEDSHSGWWYGSFIKVRMRELPQKFNLTTHVSTPLGIAEDEGIAEPCTFMYIPENGILLTYKSQYAPPLSKLGEYLENRNKLMPIAFNPVLKSDALRRFAQMTTATKIEIKAAGLNAAPLSNFHSAATLMSSFKNMGCINVSLVLTGDRNLGLKDGIDIVKGLLDSEATDTLRITGYGSDPEKTDILDLLEDQLVEKGTRGTSDRTLTYQVRKNILHEAYMAHRSDLNGILKK